MDQFNIIGKRGWRRFYQCQEAYHVPEFCDFFRNPNRYLLSHGVEVIKDNPVERTKVVRLKLCGCDWIVTRYAGEGWRHWLQRGLLPSKALLAWGNALGLFGVGIATPTPIAMIEQRFGPLRGMSYYVSEYCEGVAANQFLQSNTEYVEYGAQVREAINHLTEKLHAAGYTHAAWSLNSILLVDLQPLVMDIDQLQHFTGPSQRFTEAKNRDWDGLVRSAESTVFNVA